MDPLSNYFFSGVAAPQDQTNEIFDEHDHDIENPNTIENYKKFMNKKKRLSSQKPPQNSTPPHATHIPLDSKDVSLNTSSTNDSGDFHPDETLQGSPTTQKDQNSTKKTTTKVTDNKKYYTVEQDVRNEFLKCQIYPTWKNGKYYEGIGEESFRQIYNAVEAQPNFFVENIELSDSSDLFHSRFVDLFIVEKLKKDNPQVEESHIIASDFVGMCQTLHRKILRQGRSLLRFQVGFLLYIAFVMYMIYSEVDQVRNKRTLVIMTSVFHRIFSVIMIFGLFYNMVQFYRGVKNFSVRKVENVEKRVQLVNLCLVTCETILIVNLYQDMYRLGVYLTIQFTSMYFIYKMYQQLNVISDNMKRLLVLVKDQPLSILFRDSYNNYKFDNKNSVKNQIFGVGL